MISFTVSPAEIIGFTAILFRMGGIMVFAPFFNGSAIPAPVKAVIPLVLALTLLPVAPAAAAPADFTLLHILVIVCSELLVGFVLGLTASLLFAGFQMAGQIMGFQLGFSIVNIIDPQTSVQVSVLSILSNFLGLMFFLLMDGHHWLVQAVSGSLDYLPVGGARLTGPVVEMVMRLSSQIFVSGLQIAAPVVAATITADVLMGIIGRVAPQVNILIVGMPVKTLVGLGTMSVTFYFLPTLFGRYFLELSGVLMGLVQRLG